MSTKLVTITKKLVECGFIPSYRLTAIRQGERMDSQVVEVRDRIGRIIEKLGGAVKLASDLESTPESVRMWRYVGRIPHKYRYRVFVLARAGNIKLAMQDLALLGIHKSDV